MSRLGMMVGMDVYVVASGTEVGKDEHGAPLIVTDQNAVTSACCMWITEKVFEELKARSTEAKVFEELKARSTEAKDWAFSPIRPRS